MEHPTHLTADQLAGYLDDGLVPEDRRAVETHLDACAECRGELIEVVRLIAPEVEVAAGRPGVGRWSWWASAAVAAGIGALVLMRPGATSRPEPANLERPSNGASESMPRLTVVAPLDGATVTRSGVAFTWRSRQADTYRLTLLSETGVPIWSVDTSDTVALLPSSIGLTPGGVYFWRVDAIADGVSASTGVQRIEITP